MVKINLSMKQYECILEFLRTFLEIPTWEHSGVNLYRKYVVEVCKQRYSISIRN